MPPEPGSTSSFFTMSSSFTSRLPGRKTTAFTVAALAASSYFVLRYIPRRLIESLMYYPRPYGKNSYAPLLNVTWNDYKLEEISVPIAAQSQSGGGNSAQRITHRKFFLFAPTDFFQRDFRPPVKDAPEDEHQTASETTSAAAAPSPSVSSSRPPSSTTGVPIRQVWLVYGGNGMVALEWLSSAIQWTSRTSDERAKKDYSDLLPDLATPRQKPAFIFADYPGYGSTYVEPEKEKEIDPEALHKPNRDNIYQSTVEILNRFEQLVEERDPEPVAQLQFNGLGHSIGCAALLDYLAKQATAAAGEDNDEAAKKRKTKTSRQFDTLILSAPFTSVRDMAQRLLPQLESVPKFVLDFAVPPEQRWDNVKAVEELFAKLERFQDQEEKKKRTAQLGEGGRTKIHMIHGAQDEICPIEHGREVHRKFAEHLLGGTMNGGAGYRHDLPDETGTSTTAGTTTAKSSKGSGKINSGTSTQNYTSPSFYAAPAASHNDILDLESFWYEFVLFYGRPPTPEAIRFGKEERKQQLQQPEERENLCECKYVISLGHVNIETDLHASAVLLSPQCS
ncbi:unnamed protein product [Amoebophrya sp. A120]|nr:unnamed protein product [Amoebophrya sp. A120]|eukprot:GSA120T00019547001.1